jgi:hypothetical protein
MGKVPLRSAPPDFSGPRKSGLFRPDADDAIWGVAAVLMLQKYKPTLCGGSPCTMQFPFRMGFRRPP